MPPSTSDPAARICRCGTPFPPDRAPQARYHSDRCANRYRQADRRARESRGSRLLEAQLATTSEREALDRWRGLSAVDRHALFEAGGLLSGEEALAVVTGFADPSFLAKAA
jgi:hypothetical protein